MLYSTFMGDLGFTGMDMHGNNYSHLQTRLILCILSSMIFLCPCLCYDDNIETTLLYL